MGSRSARISAQTIAALHPGDFIWDTELSRFGVRRRDTSTSYVVKVRIGGRQRWITLGKHGPLTPPEARAKARFMLAEIDCGRDPTCEREQRRRMPTMGEFADKWFNEHVAIKRKPSTAIEYQRIIARHIKPTIGSLPLNKVGHADVESVHSGLAAQRYVANRVVAVISSIMSHAERHELRPRNSNPCRGLERFREGKRKRPLSRTELARLWAHLKEIEATDNPYIVAALRLLLLTGMRKSEVLNLLWSDVDLEAGLIRLRDAKTGPRDVVLSGDWCARGGPQTSGKSVRRLRSPSRRPPHQPQRPLGRNAQGARVPRGSAS